MDTAEQTKNSKADSVRRTRRVQSGIVESDARDKTIRVRINRLIRHPKYGKLLKRKTVLHAHDEKNEAKVGDRVEIVECRPISKTKSWRLSRFISQGSGK